MHSFDRKDCRGWTDHDSLCSGIVFVCNFFVFFNDVKNETVAEKGGNLIEKKGEGIQNFCG